MYMNSILLLLAVTFLTTVTSEGKELQLFNTAVLGQPVEKNIKLLQDKAPDSIEPVTVMVDIKNGIYIAATIQYPDKLSFEEAREHPNKLYKQYEITNFSEDPLMGLWRNEDMKFAIQLTRVRNVIEIRYIQFTPDE
jgi:hypothetical protein